MWNSGASPNFLPAQLKPPLTRSRYFRGGTVGNKEGRTALGPRRAIVAYPQTQRWGFLSQSA
jgi:hypothetical protein